MRRLPLLRPIVAAVAVLALVGGACSQDEDVTQERFAADLRERAVDGEGEATLTEEEADCFAAAVFERYEQAEVNRIYTAATEDELTNERRDELLEIATDCGIEAPAPAPADEPESTTTTEAE